MMKLMQIRSHWSPEEAHSMLMLLDELRDAIWNNYRDEIIAFAQGSCHQQQVEKNNPSTFFEDDTIPF